MEDLLLLWDELDDAVAAARHLAPRLLGFLAAFALFALTVLSFLFLPKVTLGALAVLLTVVLLERVRRHLLPLAKTSS
jgi:hypothetical protein